MSNIHQEVWICMIVWKLSTENVKAVEIPKKIHKEVTVK